jgi:ASC-1-like (ASCH) protein
VHIGKIKKGEEINMDREKLKIYMRNIEENKKARENNTLNPIPEIENNINTIVENIQLFKEKFEKHKLTKNKKEFSCQALEVLNRNILSDILEYSNIFDTKLTDKKKQGNFFSHVIARVNATLKDKNMRIGTISNIKNQYRICVSVPKEYFN